MYNSTAALIVIGNEILSGRTQDKNIAFLATELNECGIPLREVRVIPDVESVIIDTVNTMRPQYTYVFTTGGIGPTHDDITSASIAKAFGVALTRHPDAEAALRAHYSADMINEARLKMADVPKGAKLIVNDVSAAPGFAMENVYVMAGVPRIMQAMFAAIKPLLNGSSRMYSSAVATDLPEGTLAEPLAAIQKEYSDTEIGSYPVYKQGGFMTSLVVRSSDPKRNDTVLDAIRIMISQLGGEEMNEMAADN